MAFEYHEDLGQVLTKELSGVHSNLIDFDLHDLSHEHVEEPLVNQVIFNLFIQVSAGLVEEGEVISLLFEERIFFVEEDVVHNREEVVGEWLLVEVGREIICMDHIMKVIGDLVRYSVVTVTVEQNSIFESCFLVLEVVLIQVVNVSDRRQVLVI